MITSNLYGSGFASKSGSRQKKSAKKCDADLNLYGSGFSSKSGSRQKKSAKKCDADLMIGSSGPCFEGVATS